MEGYALLASPPFPQFPRASTMNNGRPLFSGPRLDHVIFSWRPRLCSNCAESTPAQQGPPLVLQTSIRAWVFSGRGLLNKGHPSFSGPRVDHVFSLGDRDSAVTAPNRRPQQGAALVQQASICARAFSDRGPRNKGRPLLSGPRSENAQAQIDAC